MNLAKFEAKKASIEYLSTFKKIFFTRRCFTRERILCLVETEYESNTGRL